MPTLPRAGPTSSPTAFPTSVLTFAPTEFDDDDVNATTAYPTVHPTGRPTVSATDSPTGRPTRNPTRSPTTQNDQGEDEKSGGGGGGFEHRARIAEAMAQVGRRRFGTSPGLSASTPQKPFESRHEPPPTADYELPLSPEPVGQSPFEGARAVGYWGGSAAHSKGARRRFILEPSRDGGRTPLASRSTCS